MSKKYNLNIEEILEILQNEEELAEECTGFSEKELIETENRLGVKLPSIYRNYMMHYEISRKAPSFSYGDIRLKLLYYVFK